MPMSILRRNTFLKVNGPLSKCCDKLRRVGTVIGQQLTRRRWSTDEQWTVISDKAILDCICRYDELLLLKKFVKQ